LRGKIKGRKKNGFFEFGLKLPDDLFLSLIEEKNGYDGIKEDK
jgi:hypothetical protein